MNEKAVILTLVMPFFNKKEMVVQMIRSCQANSFKEWELLAVDDGSDADTREELESLALADSRIILLTRDREPKGAPTSRNIGLEKAAGKYLIFLDSDDYVTPACFRNRVDFMERNPTLDFAVFPSGTLVDGAFCAFPFEHFFGFPVHKDNLEAFARHTLPFVVVNNIYRTSSLRKHAIRWDERLKSMQDSDFNIQSLLSGMHYDFACAQPDYGYRMEDNPKSISKKLVSEEHFSSRLYLIRKNYESFRRHFGQRYNGALYEGCLSFYQKMMEAGMPIRYAHELCKVMKLYSPFWAWVLSCQTCAYQLLRLVMSEKVALKAPLGYWLYRRKRRMKTVRERRSQLMAGYKE